MVERTHLYKKADAEEMAYKEKPYRDLAFEIKKKINEPGMANAYSTVISLAENAGDELIQGKLWKRTPDRISPSQHHVAEAAHAYVDLSTEENPFKDTSERIIFDASAFSINSPTEAIWANDIGNVFGVKGKFGNKRRYNTTIPDVKLHVGKTDGALIISAEPVTRKKALAHR